MTRKQKIASFKVVHISNPPLTRFIPVNTKRRVELYESNFLILPWYETFVRKNLEREDLYVVEEQWSITFEYMNKAYTLTVNPGAVYDVASVPKHFVRGGLTKRGQAIQEAALVHDCLFALQLLPFEDCNNVFRGMIDYTGLCNRLVSNLYMAVRGRTGRTIYNNADPKKHWLKECVIFEEIKYD